MYCAFSKFDINLIRLIDLSEIDIMLFYNKLICIEKKVKNSLQSE